MTATALTEALAQMVAMATAGAARAHLDRAGIMQDPPHGSGLYID